MTDHQVDGRQCEAKFALPRGGSNFSRTTRISVARIPKTVSDQQFRVYLEQFGAAHDAYMPKDAFKQGDKGIGFVIYASADPVEQVMSSSHILSGQELAIDCATTKDKGVGAQPQSSRRLNLQHQTTAQGFPHLAVRLSAMCLTASVAHSTAALGIHTALAIAAPLSCSSSTGTSLLTLKGSRLNPDLLVSLQGLANLAVQGRSGMLQVSLGVLLNNLYHLVAITGTACCHKQPMLLFASLHVGTRTPTFASHAAVHKCVSHS